MKLKYYLRGLGIGIIVSTNILAIAFANHPQEMSDEEIIARARELGMVMDSQQTGDHIPAGEDKRETEQPKETENVEGTEQTPESVDTEGMEQMPEASETENAGQKPQEPTEFTVKRGDSSNSVAARLFKAGLVDDADKFNKYLMENRYADSILPGTILIPAGADYKEIARLLTTH